MSKLTIVSYYRSQAPPGLDPRCEEPPSFLQTLPEDIRSDPSLATFKDAGTLAKSYVNAQKLIGTKRISAPQDGWGDQQWNEFYGAIGRPESGDKYEMPNIPLEEGLKLDEALQKNVRTELHKAGLTGKQFQAAVGLYLNHLNGQVTSAKMAADGAAATAIQTLKGEWGDKYDANIDIARSVLKSYGDEEMQQYVNGAMGNNVQLIKFLAKVGSQFLESKDKGGRGTLPIKDETRAKTEIETLKLDKEFQDAFGNARHPGHKAAVDRWIQLHSIAHPGKESGE